jgi:hypothetical protein
LRSSSDDGPAAGFYVVATKAMLGTMQPRHAFDADRPAADARYSGPHLFQKLAQLDDVGFGCGVADFRDTTGTGCCEECGLCARYGRFVEIHRRAAEPVGSLEHVIAALAFARSHRGKRFKVCGN